MVTMWILRLATKSQTVYQTHGPTRAMATALYGYEALNGCCGCDVFPIACLNSIWQCHMQVKGTKGHQVRKDTRFLSNPNPVTEPQYLWYLTINPSTICKWTELMVSHGFTISKPVNSDQVTVKEVMKSLTILKNLWWKGMKLYQSQWCSLQVKLPISSRPQPRWG